VPKALVEAAELASRAAPSRRRDVVVGALLMIVAVANFSSLDTILKVLVAHHGPGFLVWGRNLFQVVYLCALMPVFGPGRMLRTRRPVVQTARGLLLVLSTIFVVLALRVMPLAQTYAIGFSTPLIATVVAALALGERASPVRWTLIAVGFVGVLVALRPDAPNAGTYLIYPVAMALSNALYHVLTRYAGRDEDPLAMLFHAGFFALLFSSLALPWTWQWMAAGDWALLAVGGAFGTVGHLLLIEAFRRAPTAIVSSMLYTQIVTASSLGYLVFGDVPTIPTLLGAAIVAASGFAIIRSRF
jgi:drug/metabolite transporter (DMT)-like permease